MVPPRPPSVGVGRRAEADSLRVAGDGVGAAGCGRELRGAGGRDAGVVDAGRGRRVARGSSGAGVRRSRGPTGACGRVSVLGGTPSSPPSSSSSEPAPAEKGLSIRPVPRPPVPTSDDGACAAEPVQTPSSRQRRRTHNPPSRGSRSPDLNGSKTNNTVTTDADPSRTPDP